MAWTTPRSTASSSSAQRHNLTCGITGVLVFGSGVFFQWIEGPAAAVRKLMASLHRDPRHYDIISLDQSEEKRERLYPNWQMERVGADDIREVLQDALESAEDENNIAALKRILDHLATRSLGFAWASQLGRQLAASSRSATEPRRRMTGPHRVVRVEC